MNGQLHISNRAFYRPSPYVGLLLALALALLLLAAWETTVRAVPPITPPISAQSPASQIAAWQTAVASGAVRCGFESRLLLPLALRRAGAIHLTVIEAQPQAPNLPLPPDPQLTAPPLDMTVPSDIYTATQFLYTGYSALQIEVPPGAILPERVAVIQGQARDRQGNPLPAVRVTVAGTQQFGCTFTRADGKFDLAVNGGGTLRLAFDKAGYLDLQRSLDAPLRDYAHLDPVVMIPQDERVTAITLDAAQMQTARGSLISDTDGTRQATLFIPPGVQASLSEAPGITAEEPGQAESPRRKTPLSSLNLRLTEYTVGENGEQAMPAELPPQVGYTYAVELSADEASGRAAQVEFDRPLYFYLENFLGFPVGQAVPAGSYDASLGQWLPSSDGRVIKILAEAGGLASLDLDGDGQADGAEALAKMGISDAERQRLSQLYQPGQSLWRVSVPHLTPWDYNWPIVPPPDAVPPDLPPPVPEEKRSVDSPDADPCPGCSIEAQNQVLIERLPIAGVDFSLYYASDRAPGRAASYSLEYSLSGASLPSSLKRIESRVLIAGRAFTQTFPAAPNQSLIFTWDGFDGYGRRLQGPQPVTLRVGYVYDNVYQVPITSTAGSSFGLASGLAGTVPARGETVFWQMQLAWLGGWSAAYQGLGGWSLGVQHVFDRDSRLLYLGDGRRVRTARSGFLGIETVAGSESDCHTGDPCAEGAPVTRVALDAPTDALEGPDGSLYIADRWRVLRVDTQGIIRTFAGGGSSLSGLGDGGPAIQARLAPKDLAFGSDGSLYIADDFYDRVRRVYPSGIITTVAGTGVSGFSGDGGPAIQARLNNPYGVAVGPDGSLYIAEFDNHRVRRVDPNGIINTFAGNGEVCLNNDSEDCGDGGPATQAELSQPKDVTVGADGQVYIASGYPYRVRVVDISGIITSRGYQQYYMWLQKSLALNPQNDLFISGNSFLSGDGTILQVKGYTLLQPFAGHDDSSPYSGDGGPPLQATFRGIQGINFTPDGSLLIADTGNSRVRRIGYLTPSYVPGQVEIVSPDGAQLFTFDSQGRHLRTRHALTGALIYQFIYDANGRLIQVVDAFDNRTTIQRDSSGTPTAIIAPYGQRTSLALDNQGYLSSLTDPEGGITHYGYTQNGLLNQKTDPLSRITSYSYDHAGRLSKEQDPDGSQQSFAFSSADNTFTVTAQSALDRNSLFRIEILHDGSIRQRITDPGGQSRSQTIGVDGSNRVVRPDGMVYTTWLAPDPRWHMQAPYFKQVSIATPGGLTYTLLTTRTAALSDTTDLSSLVALTETSSLNGQAAQRVYLAASRTFTTTTPTGRQIYGLLDKYGRLAREQVNGLNPVRYSYDARGRLANVSWGTGNAARQVDYAYSDLGFLSAITNPLGRQVQLAADDLGRVIKTTFPDGSFASLAYDAADNLVALSPPGKPQHQFTYNVASLTQFYDPPAIPSGQGQRQYTYNLDRQVISVTLSGAPALEFSYNGAGRLASKLIAPGPGNPATLAYSYNSSGQLQGIRRPSSGITQTFGYDGALLVAQEWQGPVEGALRNVYDENFRLTSHVINDTLQVTYQYDADGLLIQTADMELQRSPLNGLLTGSTLGGVIDAWSYNGFGEPLSYTAKFNDTLLLSFQYTYNDAGCITRKIQNIAGDANTLDYTYDEDGRLIQVKIDGLVTASFTYDTNGNRLSASGGAATYDNQDRLLSYGSAQYEYSADGQLWRKVDGGQATLYHYSAAGELTAVDLPNGQHVEFLLDGLGRRVGRRLDGALTQGFLYRDALHPIAELDGQSNVVSVFIYGGRSNLPETILKGGVAYRILSDHLGSPRLVVNAATGAIAQRLDYDVWGRVLLDTNPGFQPFGFAGGLYDPATQTTHFGARDYDAWLGRWLGKEPQLFNGGLNLYAYARNDPVNFVDPSGLTGELVSEMNMRLKSQILADSITPNPIFETLTLQEFLSMFLPRLEAAAAKNPSCMLRADEIAQMFGETIAPLELFETLGRLDYQDRYDEFGCPRPAAEVQRRQAARLAQMEKEWQECPELAP